MSTLPEKVDALNAFKKYFPTLFDDALNYGTDGLNLVFNLTGSRRVTFYYLNDDNFTMKMEEID